MTAAPDPRSGPNTFFTADHRHCDELWAKVEAAADGAGPESAKAAAKAFAAFDAALRLHLEMEEEILFPAIERAMNMHGMGPTQMMRMEHMQMRGVLDTMARAAANGAVDGVLDHGDTLMMLIQQHNLKEEGILYPMAERGLAGSWAGIAEQLVKKYGG